ncbi:hypothetical protein IU449_28570 [Nocardia higoensis]|uniref:Uncharacterized protein n=1 Tax=Nocardia higoensis TaxID=228599 RepID=A0ABS0DJ18_9NOCA|nr:hypothetical protein [Nocardia higoensis]MBF6358455.1 hypothetical protein [Nocardia higoensis]
MHLVVWDVVQVPKPRLWGEPFPVSAHVGAFRSYRGLILEILRTDIEARQRRSRDLTDEDQVFRLAALYEARGQMN